MCFRFKPLIYDLLQTDGEFYSHKDLGPPSENVSSAKIGTSNEQPSTCKYSQETKEIRFKNHSDIHTLIQTCTLTHKPIV